MFWSYWAWYVSISATILTCFFVLLICYGLMWSKSTNGNVALFLIVSLVVFASGMLTYYLKNRCWFEDFFLDCTLWYYNVLLYVLVNILCAELTCVWDWDHNPDWFLFILTCYTFPSFYSQPFCISLLTSAFSIAYIEFSVWYDPRIFE